MGANLCRFLTVLIAFIVANSQFYSKRTKCSENKLSFDSEIANFYQNTQFSGVNYTEIMDVMGMIKKLYHFGKKVSQTPVKGHQCEKYFLAQEICCRFEDLDQFVKKMGDLYKRTYFKAKHPMVDYMYGIYDTYKTLNPNCLSSIDLRLPQRNNTNYLNVTQPLGDLINKIANEVSKIKDFEIDFIYNTGCLLCLGIDDFKTFIHPVHQDVVRTKRLIYNKDYWSNATLFIATRMSNCRNYADQIQTYIKTQLKSKLSSSAQCTALGSLINNEGEIAKRKVCDTDQECIKFAQKYIGAPTAPAYSKTFSSIQQKRGITKTNYRLVTSTFFGFKGNETYVRYVNGTLPLIQIRGNDYIY